MLEKVIWNLLRKLNKIGIINLYLHKEEYPNLKQHLFNKGYDSYPVLLEKHPSFAKLVNDYIQQKSKKELPLSQFTNDTLDLEFQDIQEIRGIVGYDEKVFEMFYEPGSASKTKLEDIFSLGLILGTTHKRKWCQFEFSDIKRSEAIINWHSHFGKETGLNLEDAEQLLSFESQLKKYFNVKAYMVIFYPLQNSFEWYKTKKVEPI